MDVYETTDLPEDDQNAQAKNEPTLADCVEPIDVSVQQAFTQFRSKVIDAADVDFSDNIGRVRCSGYVADTSVQALGFEGGDETLEQKCQRLQQELRQLAKEMELTKENTKGETPLDGISAMDLVNQTDYLKRQMIDLSMETQLGVPNSLSLSDPREALQKRLLTELNGFHSPSSKPLVAPKSIPLASDDSNHVNYQLFYRPEQTKFCNNARIAGFEQRIERLEAVLGQSPEKLALLTSETSNKTLMSALCMLLAKMKVLDTGYLDLLEPRLASVYHRVGRSVEKKESTDQIEKFNKVSGLMDLVEKVNSISGTMSTVIDKLSKIGPLHNQALQVSQTLVNLDLSQRQMIEGFSEDTAMLKQFQELLTENTSKMASNTTNLDDRLKIIQRK